MATLSIISNFTATLQGLEVSGKQGLAASGIADALDITVGGQVHKVVGSLGTATISTVWDDDNDSPTDFDFLFFWADVDMYIQLIGSGTNVIFKVDGTVPFWLPGFDTLLAAADTTPIAGGTEPTLQDIDSVVIGNYTGGTGNYVFAVID